MCIMFCDVVFDHLVVMRHNGGCSQQVTTEGHKSQSIDNSPALNLCQGQQKSQILSSFLSISNSRLRIDQRSCEESLKIFKRYPFNLALSTLLVQSKRYEMLDTNSNVSALFSCCLHHQTFEFMSNSSCQLA